MHLRYEAPRPYNHTIAPFTKEGKITDRTRNGLENVLALYTDVAQQHAKLTDNNPENYTITDVLVPGSGARENRIDSDLDLLLIAPRLDEESARNMKLFISMVFFNNRPKQEAIDVFVRKEDIYPHRASVAITDQVQHMLKRYNSKLKS